MRGHERNHARHEGERGHQDGPQAIAICLQNGWQASHAFTPQVVGVINLQNGVFLDHAEQHQDAEHRVDVELLAEQDHADERERQGQGQRDQDRDRVQPGFELSGEHQVHEDEREREGEQEVLPGARHLTRGARRGDLVFCGHVLALHDLLQLVTDGAFARARRRVAADRHLALPVEAVDGRRSRTILQLNHVTQRHEAEPRRRHSEQPQPLFIRAVLGFGAHVHFILLAALLVRRDLHALDQQPQRVGHVDHLHAQVSRASAVDVHADFWFARNQ